MVAAAASHDAERRAAARSPLGAHERIQLRHGRAASDGDAAVTDPAPLDAK
jgi:hypothetical protein